MYIFTHANLYLSARALRNKINELSGYRFSISNSLPEGGTIGIRWGNSSNIITDIKDKKLNDPRLIKIFSNKKLFSEMFKDDFWVPRFFQKTPTEKDFPLLIRTNLSSFGGRGIIPCATMKDFEDNWEGIGYWTPYIILSSEFRIHIFDGNILRIFKKSKNAAQTLNELRKQEQEKGIFEIRNAHRGWKFELVGTTPDSLVTLKNLGKKFWNSVADKFNLNHCFFALDVGWYPERKTYFILEGNTAPSLYENEHTRTLYAENFINVLNL